MVYPFLRDANGRLNGERFTARSLTYTMAQIDYPIPILDRGWGQWSHALGADALLSQIVSQEQCAAIIDQNQYCTRPQDCNFTWSHAQSARFCGAGHFEKTTFSDLQQSYTWPTDTAFQRGMTKLWYMSRNLASLPSRFASNFHLLVYNKLNGTDANSIIHSDLWARLYATYAEESGAQYAVYYTDYPGIKPSDRGQERIAASGQVTNYRSNFGWRATLPQALQGGLSGLEDLLLHCRAFNMSCQLP